MENDLVSGLLQLMSGENRPGSQNMQVKGSYPYPYSPQDPEDAPIDNTVSAEKRPMRVNPMYNFIKDRMGAFPPMLSENIKERMTHYWNPQTRTWDNDRADGVIYGSSQYYNFDTGEYREPTEFELNPHMMNPMSPNFNPFGR